jgi:hypothetical protein
MEALGRLFNVVGAAVDIPVSLENASGVTFICLTDDDFTVQEHIGFGGAGQDLDTVDHYYAASAADGSVAWTRETQTADAVVDADGALAVAIYVGADQLSDGYTHVDVGAAGAGTVIAIVHDLAVARTPQNLPALGA